LLISTVCRWTLITHHTGASKQGAATAKPQMSRQRTASTSSVSAMPLPEGSAGATSE
jgi:hypothetical protein